MTPRRRPMTPARKLRIWTGQRERDPEGVARCGCGCGEPVPLDGPGVIYEHRITFWTRPDLDDDGPNVQAWLAGCSAAKTGGKGGDLSTIAKTKRQMTLRLDVPRETAASKGRGIFVGGSRLPAKGMGPKLKGRGFSKTHRPLRSRNSFAAR